MDLYLILCYIRDKCFNSGEQYKAMTYENIRDILELKLDSRTNATIYRALSFLSSLNLIKFSIGYTCNQKLAKIPVFKIEEVNYYIDKPIINFETNELMTEEDIEEIKIRVKNGFLK